MKKTKLFILFLGLLPVLGLFSGCEEDTLCIEGNRRTVTRDITGLSPFTKVFQASIAEVVITKGAAFSVRVTGEENIVAEHEFRVQQGELFIETRENNVCLRPNQPLTVAVTMPVLESAVLAGSGSIRSSDSFESDRFFAELSGSGDIDLVHVADEATIRLIGSGNIALAGAAAKADILLSGSGNIAAFGYAVGDCTVRIAGSGNCDVQVNNRLNATISGSGNIRYKGNPTVNTTITGSGKVVNAN